MCSSDLQWGSSLAFAGALFGIDVTVFQVRVSYDQKPYRRALMETYGARCVPSPSNETDCGRAILKQYPDSPGSLGIAISEAVEVAGKDPAVKYSLGSVLNHVLLHQTVVGQEAIKQFEAAGDDPDIVIACAGGGSNFAGMKRRGKGSSISFTPKATPNLPSSLAIPAPKAPPSSAGKRWMRRCHPATGQRWGPRRWPGARRTRRRER